MARPTGERRSTYHHGNLRLALIDAGMGLASTGGPEAVVLREVARSVGVTANAAYRHFDTLSEFKRAVALKALTEMGAAIAAHLDRVVVAEPNDPRAAAIAHLREVGRGYVLFALEEPGLFRMAMSEPSALALPAPDADHGPDWDGRPKPDHYLMAALDRLVEVEALSPESVPGAALACWATAHGLSTLLPNLSTAMSSDERQAGIDAVLDILLKGLTG
ncbi:TetR/AcrR family transcriptional regulator [Cryptosporangium arvum]|uniref:Transcriptional regulator, TetR family n=1 Tax=Cryptosporangium arvum DSM 44712 TaxID=927661 RepID=A0A010Z3Y1_9ACTN|nr:TetR/AcrR family transcriptional regulator [Cryptosporangium arvum]EXG82098.1 transcriptional regulator, TetR family [Cryptosporangium arvum DSM 44712]